jgi:hypothetical protein
MINKKTESFLEKTDMNYLFCLLAKLESQRLSQLPTYVRQRFPEKIAVMSMDHVSDNEVPDYFAEIEEANLAMEQQNTPFKDDEGDVDLGDETFDDTKEHIEELVHDNLDSYADDDDENEFDLGDDDADDEED